MKRYGYMGCLLVFLTVVTFGAAEGDASRTWTSTVGTTLEAELVEAKGERVVLRGADGAERTVRLAQLSEADRRYVAEFVEARDRGEPRIPGLDAEPGSISGPIRCAEDSEWSYYLYLPEDFHDGRLWPVWFVMSPGGGKGGGALRRYVEGAERWGCVLALSVESKNHFADSDLAIEAMVEDVYERVPVAEDLAFASGMSGGSRMAYWLAEVDRDIAGVLACGSGKGIYLKADSDRYREAELRGSTYVYSLIGTNCFNRTGAFQSHDTFPDDYRLRFFPGGHAWAGAGLIAEGMGRVLGAGLERYRDGDARLMREQFARAAWEWTSANVASRPWEAHYWADYLEDFPGPGEIQADAMRLARDLKDAPKVRAARRAERDIRRFAEEYFDVFYKVDKKANPDRRREADRLADRYPGIPHGELLRRLGDSS